MGEDISSSNKAPDWEAIKARGLATSIEELPPIPEGSLRGIHFTSPDKVMQIIGKGLDYSRQGMLMSTARLWSNTNEIEYSTDDKRFAEGSVDIVFDLTFAESRLHNSVIDSPGLITSDHLIGIIDPYR